MQKLTAKQKVFADRYLSNGNNGTEAAIFAGYSENGAKVTASVTLTKINVAAYIKVEQDKTSKKLNITRESLLEEIQFGKDAAKRTLDNQSASVIPQFTAFFKAIEMHGKMLGLNEPDKLEITGRIESVVEFGER